MTRTNSELRNFLKKPLILILVSTYPSEEHIHIFFHVPTMIAGAPTSYPMLGSATGSNIDIDMPNTQCCASYT